MQKRDTHNGAFVVSYKDFLSTGHCLALQAFYGYIRNHITLRNIRMSLEHYKKNGRGSFPLPIPFRRVYLLTNLHIANNEIRVVTDSRVIPYTAQQLAFLLESTIREMRNGEIFRHSSLLSNFKNYYESILKNIPEEFVVKINNTVYPFDHEDIIFWSKFYSSREYRFYFRHAYQNSSCISCKYKSVCRFFNIPSHTIVDLSEEFEKYHYIFSERYVMKFIDFLLSKKIDPARFFFYMVFVENKENWDSSFLATIRRFYEGERVLLYVTRDFFEPIRDDGYLFGSGGDEVFVEMPTGNIFKAGEIRGLKAALDTVKKGGRIYYGSKDVTDEMVEALNAYNYFFRWELLGRVERVAGNYPKEERFLIYYALLKIRPIIPDRVKFISKVLESRVYKDGLIEIGNEGIILPTRKLMDMMGVIEK